MEGVEKTERQIVLMELAVHRIAREVAQRVVHPAQIPFVAEAEAADLRRTRDHRPRGRFLGDHRRAREPREHEMVQATEELDGFEILAAAVFVGQPLAGGAAVVAIEQRRDRIDAQAVDRRTGRSNRARWRSGNWRLRGGRDCR